VIHDHQFADAGKAIGPCRLCGANDVEAVIEKLAEDLWESRRHGSMEDLPWDAAGPYWQDTFRELAASAVESLKGGN